MSARGRYVLTVFCDDSPDSSHISEGVKSVYAAPTRAEAIRNARAAGWQIRADKRETGRTAHRSGEYTGKALCPDCVRNKIRNERNPL
jgi:hypothetical protein